MIELTLFILVFISVSVGHADKAVEWSIGGGGALEYYQLNIQVILSW